MQVSARSLLMNFDKLKINVGKYVKFVSYNRCVVRPGKYQWIQFDCNHRT